MKTIFFEGASKGKQKKISEVFPKGTLDAYFLNKTPTF